MEGGQKIDINLASPIDTKSSDMLVSVQDTRFAHNRQRYQGHVLPTSVRYEHDGYAAGWYVYEFDFEGGYIFSNKSSSTVAPYMAASRVKLNSSPAYVVSFRVATNNTSDEVQKPKEFQIWYNDSFKWFDHPDVSLTGSSSNYANTSIGVKYNNKAGTFNYVPLATLITVSGSSVLTLDYVSKATDGTIKAKLTDLTSAWTSNVNIPWPKSVPGLTLTNINSNGYFWDVDNTSYKIVGRPRQAASVSYKLSTESSYGGDPTISYSYKVIGTIPFEEAVAVYQTTSEQCAWRQLNSYPDKRISDSSNNTEFLPVEVTSVTWRGSNVLLTHAAATSLADVYVKGHVLTEWAVSNFTDGAKVLPEYTDLPNAANVLYVGSTLLNGVTLPGETAPRKLYISVYLGASSMDQDAPNSHKSILYKIINKTTVTKPDDQTVIAPTFSTRKISSFHLYCNTDSMTHVTGLRSATDLGAATDINSLAVYKGARRPCVYRNITATPVNHGTAESPNWQIDSYGYAFGVTANTYVSSTVDFTVRFGTSDTGFLSKTIKFKTLLPNMGELIQNPCYWGLPYIADSRHAVVINPAHPSLDFDLMQDDIFSFIDVTDAITGERLTSVSDHAYVTAGSIVLADTAKTGQSIDIIKNQNNGSLPDQYYSIKGMETDPNYTSSVILLSNTSNWSYAYLSNSLAVSSPAFISTTTNVMHLYDKGNYSRVVSTSGSTSITCPTITDYINKADVNLYTSNTKRTVGSTTLNGTQITSILKNSASKAFIYAVDDFGVSTYNFVVSAPYDFLSVTIPVKKVMIPVFDVSSPATYPITTDIDRSKSILEDLVGIADSYEASGTYAQVTDITATADLQYAKVQIYKGYLSVGSVDVYSNDSDSGVQFNLAQTASVKVLMTEFFGAMLPSIDTRLTYDIANSKVTCKEPDANTSIEYKLDGSKEPDANTSIEYKLDGSTKATINGLVVEEAEIKNTLAILDSATKNFMYNKLSWDIVLNTFIYFKPKGIYKFMYYEGTTDPNGSTSSLSVTVSGTNFTFNVKGTVGISNYNASYTLNFANFSKVAPTKLNMYSTDIRGNVENKKHIATITTSDEMQLVKQQWDATTATENFWWLDDTHILRLDKDNFVVLKKVDGDVDDWNGDTWTVDTYPTPSGQEYATKFNRGDYIPSDVTQYIVTSANNSKAYLCCLSVISESSIDVVVYDPLSYTVSDKLYMQEVFHRSINIVHRKLGTVLNNSNKSINTYNAVLASTLLTESKITATALTNNTVYIGLQLDRNFCQWTLMLNVQSDTYTVFQGYGCVGIDGSLTGGMLPVEYFTNYTGFNSTVNSISSLDTDDEDEGDVSKFNAFTEQVVGDGNQQWYITKKITGIVSHIDAEGTPQVLPISNSYSQVYRSPSFVRQSVYNITMQTSMLSDMLGNTDSTGVWKKIITAAGFPVLIYFNPYTNILNYLQQTLGQYAYVHYNSTSAGKAVRDKSAEQTVDNVDLTEETTHINPVLQDDLSFDVVHIPQEQDFGDNEWSNVLGIFGRVLISALDMTVSPTVVNTMQNQTTTLDIGKKFGQAFLQNLNSMSVTSMNQQSTLPTLKSEVTAVKTLDMFYSTSASQKCFAGPGFVNHNFVAQCTAQSVTSVQVEAQQTQIFVMLKSLTLWQLRLANAITESISKALEFNIDAQGGTPFFLAGVASGTSYGWLVSLALTAVWLAAKTVEVANHLAADAVADILDTFLPNGIQANVTSKVSRHNYDIEGKHAYGSKSESFMWPCYGCEGFTYTDETVEAVVQEKPWELKFALTKGSSSAKQITKGKPGTVTDTPLQYSTTEFTGDIPYYIASCKGVQKQRALPPDTAFVIGAESFMSTVAFKNENIGEGEPIFPVPLIQDYLINKDWNLSVTATEGNILWVACKDTKLFDGKFSNIVITDGFCGVAAPHVAVEVKREVSQDYLRPAAVTPDVLGVNITGLNCLYEEKAYHAFDGYGYRITDWIGSAGMSKEHYVWQYCFQKNDRFKRSNKLAPNQFLGNFQTSPSIAVDLHDDVYNDIAVVAENKNLQSVLVGEDRDQRRYSLPVFTEFVSSLPAVVRALSPYQLAVFEGITSLTTQQRTIISDYKIPSSVDFAINNNIYRITNEYICSVEHEGPTERVHQLVPTLGLTFLGASPYAAYLYNQATRQYYVYTGGMNLKVMDMLERFRDIKSGTYDFINQAVVMPCLATFDRLDSQVTDDNDETDNVIIPMFYDNYPRIDITPPATTIFNTKSWFKTLSLTGGLTYQGPNRCVINRTVWSEYMLEDIKNNKGKWVKVSRENYHPFRKYTDKYTNVTTNIDANGLKGWTHNPFLLVTAPLGINEETDCMFEWEVTFAWTVEMERLFEDNEYVVVNILAETFTTGGKIVPRPTHIFLTKELFTRSGNPGYYSFRYQSKGGGGNRERLHIWSDGYIAISSIQLEYKIVTDRRNTILTQQADVKGLKEM